MAEHDHPKPIRLFDLSRDKVKPTVEERIHIRQCDECQTIIAIFARQFNSPKSSKDKPENAA
jgi:hypothetical protein